MADPHAFLDQRLFSGSAQSTEGSKEAVKEGGGARKKTSEVRSKQSTEPISGTQPTSGNPENLDKTQYEKLEGEEQTQVTGEASKDNVVSKSKESVTKSKEAVTKSKEDIGMTASKLEKLLIPIMTEEDFQMSTAINPAPPPPPVAPNTSAKKSITRTKKSGKKGKRAKAKKVYRKGDHLFLLIIGIILFLGQMGLALTVMFFELRDLNDNEKPAFFIILITIAGTFIILSLASVVLDGLLFTINKKRHKHNVRPAKLTSIKTVLQSLKIFMIVANIMAILLWREYHGVLSLDMDKATAETLQKRQNLEVTVIKSIIITLLELNVFLFVETYLLSFGPRIVRRLRKKKVKKH